MAADGVAVSSSRVRGVPATLAGSFALAVLSTLGDWIWARWIPRGEVIHGVVHGAVIFVAIGVVLGLAGTSEGVPAGTRLRRLGRAVAGQLVIGVAVSASFYPLYRWIGVASLFVTWMALWWLTALWQRTLTPDRPSKTSALLRGTVAAVLSGAAFWAISGIWTNPDPDGPNLAFHLLCWFVAFLPGFAALLLRFSDARRR